LWGTEIYAPATSLQEFPVYRILASADATTVTVDQGAGRAQTFQLNKGQFRELRLPGSNQLGARITSSQPVLVVHYGASLWDSNTTYRRAFTTQLVPVSNFAQSFRFYAMPGPDWQNKALIVVPNNAIDSVQLNGANVDAGLFASLPGGVYRYAEVPVSSGQNVITCDQPIMVYSAGYNPSGGKYDHQSYATPAGF
jgi:hypothetical protein